VNSSKHATPIVKEKMESTTPLIKYRKNREHKNQQHSINVNCFTIETNAPDKADLEATTSKQVTTDDWNVEPRRRDRSKVGTGLSRHSKSTDILKNSLKSTKNITTSNLNLQCETVESDFIFNKSKTREMSSNYPSVVAQASRNSTARRDRVDSPVTDISSGYISSVAGHGKYHTGKCVSSINVDQN